MKYGIVIGWGFTAGLLLSSASVASATSMSSELEQAVDMVAFYAYAGNPVGAAQKADETRSYLASQNQKISGELDRKLKVLISLAHKNNITKSLDKLRVAVKEGALESVVTLEKEVRDSALANRVLDANLDNSLRDLLSLGRRNAITETIKSAGINADDGKIDRVIYQIKKANQYIEEGGYTNTWTDQLEAIEQRALEKGIPQELEAVRTAKEQGDDFQFRFGLTQVKQYLDRFRGETGAWNEQLAQLSGETRQVEVLVVGGKEAAKADHASEDKKVNDALSPGHDPEAALRNELTTAAETDADANQSHERAKGHILEVRNKYPVAEANRILDSIYKNHLGSLRLNATNLGKSGNGEGLTRVLDEHRYWSRMSGQKDISKHTSRALRNKVKKISKRTPKG